MKMRRTWSAAAVTACLCVAPVLAEGPTTASTTQPDERTTAVHNLAAKIRQLNAADEKEAVLPQVAFFDLSTPIVEKPADFSLFGGDGRTMSLRSLVERMHQARDDRNVRAVLLNVNAPGTNLSQSQEVRDALVELRDAGKKTFVYADGYDTDSYTIASGATDVCLLPGGEMMLPGVGIQTMYLKGLFDKLGVQADYVMIGKYKGADEEFTRTEASPEFKGEIDKLMDGLYAQVVDGIGGHRKLPVEKVKAAIDRSILTAGEAKDEGFIDHLVDPDGLRELMETSLGTKVRLVSDYGAEPHDAVDLSNPFALIGLLTKRPVVSDRPTVALVYADGVIVDGQAGTSLLDGATVGSDTIRTAMREIARDDHIKAVVIRINSPGGSALASEAMWQAVRRVAKTKPVVISVGNMAASGGYYLACAGDEIYADPSAIVGSIGVVGGKFVTKDLYDKLGLSTQTFSRGRNAGMFSSDTPFTDAQREMVRTWMTQTYDQFKQRVMSTRGGKIKQIDDVAQGRIFVAAQAKELGLVDELGGLDAAVTDAAGRAHLGAKGYDVRVVPAPKTIADLLSGPDETTSIATTLRPRVELMDTSVLQAVPADVRAMVGEQLEILQLLQRRPVVLAAPFVLHEK